MRLHIIVNPGEKPRVIWKNDGPDGQIKLVSPNSEALVACDRDGYMRGDGAVVVLYTPASAIARWAAQTWLRWRARVARIFGRRR